MTTFPPVREVVPHSGPMCLLDRILSHDEQETVCAARVEEGQCFTDPAEGVPIWIGIEYMAQCIAVHGGLIAREAGEAPRPGLFLGSRRLQVDVSELTPGSEVVVTARHLRGSGAGMQAFACSLASDLDASPLIEGNLNVMLLDALGTEAESESTPGGVGGGAGS